MNTHAVTVHQAGNPLVTYAITAVVIAVVMALRWRRMRRVMPLKLERLWIVPALYLVIAIAMFVVAPPVGPGWLFCLVALVLGAALGWQRGRMMRIAIDPETHALNQVGSPAAMLFLVAIVLLRSGARAAIDSGAGTMLHLNTLAVTDMLVALALGLFTATRVEMYLRGRRMLEAARRVS
ncbi:CcdC protein domain-containing protein [Sphingomonas sp. CROZ-RG-20F-R02-07]|uniref:CcdC protein domain-containing protein n=1 Tax=Sphingomonas sp. CROZ-RG-20F-R02-07 TaxID=2914832 RepID=UPI001F5A75F4|nr:CcdC protein domain-containing protein [Sphingomonas sp. CROZ-RG-20F-R02-07]